MESTLLSLFSALLISSTSAKESYDGCIFNLTDVHGITAEYDLTYFNLDYDVFTVFDSDNENFRYHFNICGAINALTFTENKTIPHQCAHPGTQHGPCTKITHDANGNGQCKSYASTTGVQPSAVQVDTAGDEPTCYWLGMEVENELEYTMNLLDPSDAGKGVIFTILNGEWCEAAGRNRELRIKLECPDNARIEFEPGAHRANIETAQVLEDDTCIYELEVKSDLACPNRCISRLNLEMFAVCATHGICEADPYGNGDKKYPNGTIRCLCDDGYTGDICEDSSSELRVINQNHPGLLAAIVICILLLGVAIVMAAVLCHKIRMKELEEAQTMSHLSGGMLQEANEANLQRTKDDAMTMDISGGGLGGTSAVQLQTVDDHLEKDRRRDTNELLDDEQDELEPQGGVSKDDGDDVQNEEEVEEEEQGQGVTEEDGGGDNDDAPDAEPEEEEVANPGAEE